MLTFVHMYFRSTGMQTAVEMKSSLDAAIPVGTSVSEAESRLNSRGFTVSRQINATWGDRKQVDYLYGDMSEGAIVQRAWRVAVFHEHGAVKGIDVHTNLVGP